MPKPPKQAPPVVERKPTTQPAPGRPPAEEKEAQRLRAVIKKGGVEAAYNLIEELGASRRKAADIVTNWAGSSTHDHSIMARGALTWDVEKEVEHIGFAKPFQYPEETRHLLLRGRNDPEMLKALKALEAVSQAMYDQETVKLYRGIGEAQKALIKNGEMPSGSLASFTDNLELAASFGSFRDGGVIEVTVPRSSIVMSHRAFVQGKRGKYNPNTPQLFDDEFEVAIKSKGTLTGVRVMSPEELKKATSGD
jgi:hypothetical protein